MTQRSSPLVLAAAAAIAAAAGCASGDRAPARPAADARPAAQVAEVRPAPVATTDDASRAARRLMSDDGFNLGILYRGARAPYAPRREPTIRDLKELEREFEI